MCSQVVRTIAFWLKPKFGFYCTISHGECWTGQTLPACGTLAEEPEDLTIGSPKPCEWIWMNEDVDNCAVTSHCDQRVTALSLVTLF